MDPEVAIGSAIATRVGATIFAAAFRAEADLLIERDVAKYVTLDVAITREAAAAASHVREIDPGRAVAIDRTCG